MTISFGHDLLFSQGFLAPNEPTTIIQYLSETFHTPTTNIHLKPIDHDKLAPIISKVQSKLPLRNKTDINVYAIQFEQDDSLQLYAVVSNYIGKHQPITFLSIVDASNQPMSILGTQVLAYRESIGGEVAHKKYLDQFLKKHANSQLILGQDIDNITGATLSCRSSVWATKTSLMVIESYLSKKDDHETI